MQTIRAVVVTTMALFIGAAHWLIWPHRPSTQFDDNGQEIEYLCHQSRTVGLQIDGAGGADVRTTFYDTGDFILRRVRSTDRGPTAATIIQPYESWVAFDDTYPQGLASGTEGLDGHIRLDGETNISVDLRDGLFIRTSMGLTQSQDGHADFAIVTNPHFSVGRCIPKFPTSLCPHDPH